MRIDKKEGQGSRLGLQWETLGVEMGEGGCILMFCTRELLRNFPAGRGVRFVFS